MSSLRTPVVVGLHPGAGAGTVAAALHAREGGTDRAADVVCVAEHALGRALAVIPSAGPRPVLAIRAAGPPGPPPRALGARFGAVVLIPHLPFWTGVAAPSDEIALLLGLPPERLPGPLQAYAAALREIAAAVVRSGQLTLASPPMVLLRSPHPSVPRLPPTRRRVSFDDFPDDDAVEAAVFAAAGRAG